MKEIQPFDLFNKGWALVSAGHLSDFDTMTISWGSLGTLWSRPIATVYVKTSRYTYEYMMKNDYFTVSFFDEMYREDLKVLGTHSKRDGDKMALTKLHPLALEQGIDFEEAKCTFVCRKIYDEAFDLERVPAFARENFYSGKRWDERVWIDDPHRMFIGEVVKIIER